MLETANDSIIVTLLGTGTPGPRIERFGPSTLVEAGGLRLLFDCGRGTDPPEKLGDELDHVVYATLGFAQ